jgi:hypothetical protein
MLRLVSPPDQRSAAYLYRLRYTHLQIIRPISAAPIPPRGKTVSTAQILSISKMLLFEAHKSPSATSLIERDPINTPKRRTHP